MSSNPWRDDYEIKRQRAADNIARAEATPKRRTGQDSFSTLDLALEWYYQHRDTLESPRAQNYEPDEGREGLVRTNSLEGKLALLVDLQRAMDRLRTGDPQGYYAFMMSNRYGQSIRVIAEGMQLKKNRVADILRAANRSFAEDSGVIHRHRFEYTDETPRTRVLLCACGEEAPLLEILP